MLAHLGNLAAVTGERTVFIPTPKKGSAKECSIYHKIALIAHKITLKILQARLQHYVNNELPNVQAGFQKAEETDFKLPTSVRSSKKQESSRKTSTSALLTAKTSDSVDHNKWWKVLKEMEIPDHLTCLLRNLHAGQEVTIRTGHGKTVQFTRSVVSNSL